MATERPAQWPLNYLCKICGEPFLSEQYCMNAHKQEVELQSEERHYVHCPKCDHEFHVYAAQSERLMELEENLQGVKMREITDELFIALDRWKDGQMTDHLAREAVKATIVSAVRATRRKEP